MADLALVFHWKLEDMDRLSLHELGAWRERARIRHQGSGD
ncbi:GpE family phage tail protein [Achromobacter insolitus]|nr:GpE family phage tail protein [Achromobacter insolitus]APX77297.1 hypothetical protein BUW96_22325 [Achromobacter insolitus]OWT54985.1 GpE family phage tail protein [Achromobacter insolitus]